MAEELEEILETKPESKKPFTKIDDEDYHFKTLLGIGKFISVVGWIIFAAGIIAFLVGFAADLDDAVRGGTIVGGLFGAIYSILIVAFGQLISCFVAIERNTRITSIRLAEKNK